MNDLDPIEIQFLINSTAVAGQSERVRQSLAGVDASVENSKKKFQDITREQLNAKSATDGLGASFQNLSQLTAAYFTFQGAKSFLTEIVNIRGEYQKTEIAFKTMLGSADKATEIISEMVELAAVTPFNFTEINQGAKQLLAYQVEADKVGDTVERLGNIAAGVSQPLSRLILVYGQVKAKGRLMGDDLRQFTEAGIPIIAELAKVMNTTDSEVAKLVSNGEVGFDKVNKVIQNLTNQGGMFFNLMREQSKTIPGQIANIEDALEQMFNTWGQKSEETISAALDGVSFLVENYEAVLTILGSLITTYGTYKAAIMTLNAIENVRNKTIVNEIANLSFAEKMKIGRVLVTERQAKASLLEAQAELASLQAKQASALAEGTVTARVQASILAKQVKVAATRVETAQEALSLAAKNASAVAESRLTAVQTLRAAATQLVTRAQALLNATMLSNPIVAIIAVLGGLIYAYMQLRDVTDASTKATERFNAEQKRAKELRESLRTEAESLTRTIKDENASILAQALAYEKLQKMFPETLKNMDIEAFKKADLTKKTKEFNESIEAFSLENQNRSIQESQKKVEEYKNRLERLKKTYAETYDSAVLNGLNRSIEQTAKLLEVESEKLKKNQADYAKKIELQKVSNMTVAEQKKYWEEQSLVIQNQINSIRNTNSETKNATTQVNGLLAVSTQTSNIFSMWQIPTLLNQLDIAQQKVREISGSIAGDNVVKNKAYWEEQRKTASGKNDAMSSRAENPKAWDENIRLIREAEKHLKQYDYSQKTSAKTSTARAKETKTALEEIAKAERDLAKMRMTDNAKEIAEIRDKYDKLRKQAKKEKLSQPAFDRINKLKQTEIGLVTYGQNTDALVKQLEKEKELFKLYEEAKTLIGAEEITKRYGAQLKEAKTFGERLQQEITQITTKPEADRAGAESERLNKLLEMQKAYYEELQKAQDDATLLAYEDTLTQKEKIAIVEVEYLKQRTELEKIADQQLRENKLKELDYLKSQQISAIKDEAYERTQAEQQLVGKVIAYSKNEFNARLKALEDYLTISGELLTNEQREAIEKEITRAKAIFDQNDLTREQNDLLAEKAELEDKITNSAKVGSRQFAEQLQRLSDINVRLDAIGKEKLAAIGEALSLVGGLFGSIAQAVDGLNDELAKVLSNVSELAQDVGNVVQGFSKGLVDGIVSLVATAIKWIGKLITAGKRRREEQRQREAELEKQRNENQAEYNQLLREQMLLESRLNDEYQSRVSAINEELEVLKKNRKSVLTEMESLLSQLYVFKKAFENNPLFGGSNGSFRTAWDSLGMDEYFENGLELSDELLDKLMQLNNISPLQGTLKELYDRLMRLKEEFGSIDDAMRELEKERRNIITGTTAQSLADSIKQGIAAGKKSFADFAEDIEGFLRNAILAGMSTKILEPQMQALQDMLYEMMGDGAITEEERKSFQEMYMRIVEEANRYMEMINQAGVDITGANQANSLKGAIKGITEEQADLLAGQFGGMRLAQLETNQILKSSAAYQMQACSEMIKIQGQIEFNTRKSHEVLKLIYEHLGGTFTTNNTSSLKANGF